MKFLVLIVLKIALKFLEKLGITDLIKTAVFPKITIHLFEYILWVLIMF